MTKTRRGKALAAAVAAAVTGGVAVAVATSSPALAAADSPIGFASINAYGQNGTTGGAGGRTVTPTSAAQLEDYLGQDGPLVVQIDRTISIDGMLDVASDKTVIGVGTSGRLTGGGLDVDGSHNVIIRNLTFTGADDDAINITDGAHHVWVDHNDLSGAYDGALDVKRGSDLVTVSWNHFHDQAKNSLVGHSDGNGGQDRGKLRVTYHHNFFDGTSERNPRVRFADPVHVFNNYYKDISGGDSYGAATAMNAGVLVEGNYFEGVESPTKIQIFESDPGRLVQRDNVFVDSGAPEAAGTVVEPRTFYPYTVDDPNTVPSKVRAGAGVGKLTPPADDTAAPSTPANLQATGVTASSATLAWSASTDNVGVTGYDVLSSTGTRLATATGTSHTVTGLAARTTYTFRVVARDAAGNTSGAASVTVTTAEAGGGPSTGPIGFASVNAWGQNGTTGGAGGPEQTVTTATDFIAAIKSNGPRVVKVQGMISLPAGMHEVTSDKTIIGVGADSGITGGGLNIGLPVDDDITSPPANAVHNVIIRNLNFRKANDDSINVQMFSHHIWIDHNDLAQGKDGLIDIKRGSSYVTVSWNHTHDHTKNMLLGHDDDNGAQDIGNLKVTYHNNWFDRTPQRNPRTRFGDPVHIFNNYFVSNSDVGVACQNQSGCWVEGNYFENVEEPMTTDYAGPEGSIVEKNNHYVNSGEPVVGGSVENPADYYSYTVAPASQVKSLVTAGAGTGTI